MQKKIIALALASLATGAAFAQTNVTIYGRADYGFMARGSDNGGMGVVQSRTEFGSGLASGSRIGFKGVEDLGNGLKAIFELEYGIGVDQSASPFKNTTGGVTSAVSRGTDATWVNRHSYVGLTGGFGTVVGGRLDGVRYGIYGQYDPFANGTVAGFTQITAQVDRADNAVAYISPNFGGVTATLAYSSNIAGPEGLGGATVAAPTTAVANNNDQRLQTVMVAYDGGPVSVKADYEQILKRNGLNDNKTWVATLGGSYDLGVVKLSALYDIVKGEPNSLLGNYSRRNWLIGAKAPIGKFAIKANVGRTDDRTSANADATKFGIGLDYNFSKRTVLYTDIGHISNKHGAAFGISPAGNAGGVGLGATGFDLGIAHNF